VLGDIEFPDLGGSLRWNSALELETPPAAADPADLECLNLMLQTTLRRVTAGVTIIDRGDTIKGATPSSFNGRLRHAVTDNVVLSTHARDVFWVLLKRLEQHKILPELQISCCLVKNPEAPFGRECFAHASAVELFNALEKLRKCLSLEYPHVLSLSMGHHVGPHNGLSPLEQYVTHIAPAASDRFLFVATGNDGLTGVACRGDLVPGRKSYMMLRLGGHLPPGTARPDEVLVEFWWKDPGRNLVSIEAVGKEYGRMLNLRPLRIDSQTAGQTFKEAPQGFGRLSYRSLFHARCYDDMSCVAFVLSTRKESGGLPDLDLEFTLKGPCSVAVNAWVVECTDRQAGLVGGNSEGTIRVPATAPSAVCVAGVESDGQPWRYSSSGPACSYSDDNVMSLLLERLLGETRPKLPHLAHLVDQGRDSVPGTSFSTPRAAADAAEIVCDPSRRRMCRGAKSLAMQILGDHAGSEPSWDPRVGFGAKWY